MRFKASLLIDFVDFAKPHVEVENARLFHIVFQATFTLQHELYSFCVVFGFDVDPSLPTNVAVGNKVLEDWFRRESLHTHPFTAGRAGNDCLSCLDDGMPLLALRIDAPQHVHRGTLIRDAGELQSAALAGTACVAGDAVPEPVPTTLIAPHWSLGRLAGLLGRSLTVLATHEEPFGLGRRWVYTIAPCTSSI